jgi:hypothetical protein
MRARGFRPREAALARDMRSMADAPSLRVEAFAAVTTPSFLKEGLRVGILLMLTLLNSSSHEIVFVSFPLV